jgi:hypothetical protein
MQGSNRDEWQTRRCPSLSCSTTPLRVRRDRHVQDLWWVGRADYAGTWGITAPEPRCPLCGSALEGDSGAQGTAC